MDVFRTLMRTRRTPTEPEHVGALNLIEIEFSKDHDVIAAWTEQFKHLGTEHQRRGAERPQQGAEDAEIRACNDSFDKRLMDERARLLAKLLHSMAKSLKFRIEQLEIFEGGYSPQGWADEYIEQRWARRFLLELLSGTKALPVVVYPAPQNVEGGE